LFQFHFNCAESSSLDAEADDCKQLLRLQDSCQSVNSVACNDRDESKSKNIQMATPRTLTAFTRPLVVPVKDDRRFCTYRVGPKK